MNTLGDASALAIDGLRSLLQRLGLLLIAIGVSGCAVYTVVDTAVDVTTTAVETTVDAAAGAVDLVVGDDDDDDD